MKLRSSKVCQDSKKINKTTQVKKIPTKKKPKTDLASPKPEPVEKEQKNEKEVTKQNSFKIKNSTFVNDQVGDYKSTYEIIKELGTGSFGQVYKVKHLKYPDQVYAMKIIKKRTLDDDTIVNEINCLKELDHPNIMKVYEVYHDNENFYLILELCEGQELFDYLISKGTFSENNASIILHQVLSSIAYAHKKNIVHRDLKPENIMILKSDRNELNIKIIDWGFSTIFNPNQPLNENYGTAYYVAPEVLLKNYDQKCDIWSCGVILYIMMIGSPPITSSLSELKQAHSSSFSSSSPSPSFLPSLLEKLICQKLLTNSYTLKIDCYSDLSSELKDLLHKMLTRNKDLRPQASELLPHPWFHHLKVDNTKNQVIPFSCSEGEHSHENSSTIKSLQNIRNFRADHKLVQAVLAFWAFMANSEETERLRKIFFELDTNGDGELQLCEIKEAYEKNGLSGLDVEEIVRQLDSDGNGSISYTEFIMATMNKKKMLTEEKMKQAFDAFDKDGNGVITLGEVKEVFGGEGGEELWQEVIGGVDSDGNGEIDFEEFEQMMRNFGKSDLFVSLSQG